MSSSPAIVCLLQQPLILCLSAAFVVSVVVFHVCAIRRNAKSTLISKSIASLLFVLIGTFVLTNANSWLYIFVYLGLVHGCVGDILLACRGVLPQKRSKFIAAGMIAFALGHIYYLVLAFLFLWGAASEIGWPLMLLPFVLGAALSCGNLKLAPILNISYGKFKYGVFIYGTIISLLLFVTIVGCVAAFISTRDVLSLLPIVPISLFTISDFILSMNYFDKHQKTATVKQIIQIHVCYYMAQFLFALGCSCQVFTCG